VVLVLIEHHPLIHDDRASRQQRRAPLSLHWHLRAPLKDVLEQAMARFNRLGPQLMEDASHLDSVIVVGMCRAPGRHQRPIGLLAPLAPPGGMIGGIPQDIAYLRRQERQQPGCDVSVRRLGRGQFRSQREPDRPARHRQMPCPAVPPAVPARLRPPCCRINGRMGPLACRLVRLVPDAPAGVQGYC
jgi:hypothetical protein